MDDNYFDRKIREKVEGYNDPGVDSGALAALHQKLDAVGPTIPWYKNHKLIGWSAAAVLFISLVNFSLYSFVYRQSENELLTQIRSLKENQAQLYQLQQKISNTPTIIHDTVFVIQEVAAAPQYSTDNLKKYLKNLAPDDRLAIIADYVVQANNKAGAQIDPPNQLLLVNLDDAPEEVKSYLANQAFYASIGGEKVTVRINHSDVPQHPDFLAHKGLLINPNEPIWSDQMILANISHEKEIEPKQSKAVNKDVYMSANVLRALEKNELKNYGIRIGPSLNFNKPYYDLGSDGLDAGFGVLAELVLSPSVRIETGLDYNLMEYGLSPNEITSLSQDQFERFPSLNPEFGTVNDINVSSDIIRVPINFKYFYPISKKKRLFAGAGYSSMLFLSQHFEYDYDAGVAIGDEDDFRANLTAVKREDDPKLYAGAFNLQLGVESKIKKNTYVQAAVFYQKGLDAMGAEEREIEMFGIRSSLFFKVK